MAVDSDHDVACGREATDSARVVAARQDKRELAIQLLEARRFPYLRHADGLVKGDAADRQLSSDIRRFVADMPVPLTRRQAMAVELRQVLEQHPGQEALQAAPCAPFRQSGKPADGQAATTSARDAAGAALAEGTRLKGAFLAERPKSPK